MWNTPFNPFTWDKTSNRVTSHVAGLEIRNEKEDILTMTDLSPTITVILPLDKKAARGVLNASTGNGTMLIHHGITVQYEQSMVNVSIVPQSGDAVISLVNVIPPTAGKRLECKYVRDKWIRKGGIDCRGQNPAVVTFLASHPGNYLLDFLFRAKEHIKKDQKTSKQILDKDLCIKIKEPSSVAQPENITYSLHVSESACLYWDTEKSAWKTTGCQVRE